LELGSLGNKDFGHFSRLLFRSRSISEYIQLRPWSLACLDFASDLRWFGDYTGMAPAVGQKSFPEPVCRKCALASKDDKATPSPSQTDVEGVRIREQAQTGPTSRILCSNCAEENVVPFTSLSSSHGSHVDVCLTSKQPRNL